MRAIPIRRCTSPTHWLSEDPVVVCEHERGLDVIGERTHLLVAEHGLEERKDALARSRVGREGKHDLGSLRPEREVVLVLEPPRENLPGQGVGSARGTGRQVLDLRQVLSLRIGAGMGTSRHKRRTRGGSVYSRERS